MKLQWGEADPRAGAGTSTETNCFRNYPLGISTITFDATARLQQAEGGCCDTQENPICRLGNFPRSDLARENRLRLSSQDPSVNFAKHHGQRPTILLSRQADPSPTLELLQDPQNPTTTGLKQSCPVTLATNTQRLAEVTARQNQSR